MGNQGTSYFTSLLSIAILISACGSLIISTSSRLIRVVDMCKNLCGKIDTETNKIKLTKFYAILDGIVPRIKLLGTALTMFYGSISCLALTTLFMCLDQIVPEDLNILTVGSGIIGVLIFPIASILLVIERQFTMKSIWQDLEHVNKIRNN